MAQLKIIRSVLQHGAGTRYQSRHWLTHCRISE